jgi:hypothetical protein
MKIEPEIHITLTLQSECNAKKKTPQIHFWQLGQNPGPIAWQAVVLTTLNHDSFP